MKKLILLTVTLITLAFQTQAANDFWMEFWVGEPDPKYQTGKIFNQLEQYTQIIQVGGENSITGNTDFAMNYISTGSFIYVSRKSGISGDFVVGHFISVYYNSSGDEIAHFSHSLILADGVMGGIWQVFQSQNEPHDIVIYPWATTNDCHFVAFDSSVGWYPTFFPFPCYNYNFYK